jgi:hypothetical protein
MEFRKDISLSIAGNNLRLLQMGDFSVETLIFLLEASLKTLGEQCKF